MSATFNIELFSNYFSKSSIREIEQVKVYVGIEDLMRKQEEEKKEKESKIWGPCSADSWRMKDKNEPEDEDDWVESDFN